MDLMNNYLDTLAGYINDEDKLVTYKWLSKELEVHVNLAKKILEEYWNKNKSSDQLVATIMIIGHTKDGGMRVEVVKESDFGVAADKYDRIISQHLYSLQKSLPDIQLLAEAGQGDTKFSAITCENAVLLSDEELFKRRWGSDKTYMPSVAAAAVTAERKPVETKKNIFSSFTKSSDKVSDSKTNKSNDDNGVSNGAHSSNDVKEDKVEAKKVSPVKSKPETKKGVSKKPVQSQKTGLSNLFGKVAAANSKKSPPAKNKDSADKNNDNKSHGVEESPMEVDESPKITETNGVSASKSNLKPKDSSCTSNSASDSKNSNDKSSQKSNGDIKAKNNKTKQNRGSKRNRSRDSSKEDTKKRKRIFLASDSSDESAASDPEPDLFDDPPPEEPVVVKEKSPTPPPAKQVEGKRKVRKAVDKTFMDEDGYLVTKKTFVYESASDEEPPTPAAIKEVEVKKATVAQIKKQNKQTSIMSFFKKA